MKLKPFQVTGWPRLLLLALYYAFVIVAVIIMQSRGSFSTPSFVYQGF
jgi:hypothetical protein